MNNTIIKLLLAVLILSTACNKSSDNLEDTTATSPPIINIAGIYKGDYTLYSDNAGGALSNIVYEHSYMKIDSLSPYYCSVYVFEDSLMADTLWITSFDSYDRPIEECLHYEHVNFLGFNHGLELTIDNCTTLELAETWFLGMGRNKKSFDGDKIF